MPGSLYCLFASSGALEGLRSKADLGKMSIKIAEESQNGTGDFLWAFTTDSTTKWSRKSVATNATLRLMRPHRQNEQCNDGKVVANCCQKRKRIHNDASAEDPPLTPSTKM